MTENTEKTWQQVEPAPTEQHVPAHAAPTEAQPVDVPAQPEEDTDFDHGVGDETVDESHADFDAEEQNPKEETA